MPPAPLATTHAQAPKVLKVSAKMAVPMRKTVNPIILNLMKRKSQSNAVFPKLSLAGLPIFITLKTCSIIFRTIAVFKQLNNVRFHSEKLQTSGKVGQEYICEMDKIKLCRKRR